MKGLSKEELKVIQDTGFLITKRESLSKIRGILSKTQSELSGLVKEKSIQLPLQQDFSNWKISQGENYRGLPWLVLDYPASFSKSDTFAYRTMFWWGHFFSATLQLEGSFLSLYKSAIIEHFDVLIEDDIFISVGKTPWEYHYQPNNYQLITKKHRELIQPASFLKLSKKIEITEWEKVPEFSKDFLSFLLLRILKNN